jgi:methyl-accepting chemotaxis protein
MPLLTIADRKGKARSAPDYLRDLATEADRLFVVVTALLGIISLGLAWHGGNWTAFAVLSLPAVAAAVAVTYLAPGTRLSRCTMALAWMFLTAALIHQTGGLPEAHFSAILLIALLLYYRDWLPIAVAAAAIAIHHVAFFIMQQQGMPVAVFAAGGGWTTLFVHATYVLVEAALLIIMARQMRLQLTHIGHEPRQLAQIARAVADEKPLPFDFKASDFSPRSLAHALMEANDRLTERRLQQQQSMQQIQRISSALENVTTNVMIADGDRNIVFVNRPLQIMLNDAEEDLKRDLPQFSAANLIGSNIDIFHKKPEHQAKLLETLKSTYRAQIHVGGHVMRLIVNPIIDDHGNRLGFVVEWADRTAEVQVEQELDRIVRAAAAGDFQGRVGTVDKEGFFLELAQHLNSLLEASATSIEQISQLFAALAQGDLSVRMTGNFSGVYRQIHDNANATVDQLTRIVGSIQTSSSSINEVANDLAQGSDNLSARTEQQAASLEETAAAMEELTSTVRQNANNAQQANALAMGAANVASEGGQVVGQVVTTMVDIQSASRRIAEIISVIDGIAFQTNILALNAAVEAARAGEQGRGFAVVASEVRTLAQRSAGAAKEIKELIDDSVNRVATGAELVQRAGSTMQQLVTSVQQVHDIMGAISSASQEQSQGIEQINQSIAQMDVGTRSNAALVEESLSATRVLGEQADELATAVARFKLAPDPTNDLMKRLQRMASME